MPPSAAPPLPLVAAPAPPADGVPPPPPAPLLPPAAPPFAVLAPARPPSAPAPAIAIPADPPSVAPLPADPPRALVPPASSVPPAAGRSARAPSISCRSSSERREHDQVPTTTRAIAVAWRRPRSILRSDASFGERFFKTALSGGRHRRADRWRRGAAPVRRALRARGPASAAGTRPQEGPSPRRRAQRPQTDTWSSRT
jgi:hypothetical protein